MTVVARIDGTLYDLRAEMNARAGSAPTISLSVEVVYPETTGLEALLASYARASMERPRKVTITVEVG